MIPQRLIVAIAYPLYELVSGRRIRQKLAAASERQWWEKERLERYQWHQLRLLLEHADAHVPFYRRRFEELGRSPQSFISIEDLACLPPLTKDDIQTHPEDLIAHQGPSGRRHRRSTGGSTGQNLTFVNDQNSLDFRTAAALRSDMLSGLGPGDRQAKLWGAPYEARKSSRSLISLSDWLQNRIHLDAFDMSEEEMRSFQRRLVRFRPQALIGYATCLYAFASFLERQGLEAPRPRAIISAAETLHDAQREVIERVFRCPVQNRYGCREVGPIAAECPEKGGLHIFSDERLVEVVVDGRPARAGEMGEILVTDLRNHAMPFIRYRIGDVAVASDRSCSCGRGLPLLERVVGRSSDLIVTPDGRLIHGEFFTHLFYGQGAVRRFHVHQPSIDRLDVRIVPAVDGADPDLAKIEGEIRQHAGTSMQLTMRVVDAGEIAPVRSGKFRFTTSDVARDWLDDGRTDGEERKAA